MKRIEDFKKMQDKRREDALKQQVCCNSCFSRYLGFPLSLRMHMRSVKAVAWLVFSSINQLMYTNIDSDT